MAHKLFGTDGIRGRANTEPMTAEIALRVGMAAAAQFKSADTRPGHRRRAVIGKDTRLSGYMIEPALTAGFIAMGLDVILVGPMPTPAVAMLTRSLRADLGVMISASHNPYQDNGIKLFGPDGYKLSDEVEQAIELKVDNGLADHLVPAEKLGRARRLEDARGRYNEYVKRTFPRGASLDGLKIAVDCANGAAYKVAPEVLWELGADIVPVAVEPDGTNINKGCGSTSPDALQSATLAHGCDIGIALDGDADRMLVCDEKGHLIDGDQIMALIGAGWQRHGWLAGGGVVATVMSNLGLERYLDGLGLGLVRTPVGDRNVVEHMRNHGYNFGGEQSGHLIFGDFATTGDGLIAALQVLALLIENDTSASELCRVFEPLPQVLKNVRFAAGAKPLDTASVKAAIADAELTLNGNGRLLVRASGTEPLIRVMAEGEDAGHIDGIVDDLVRVIETSAG